MKLTDKIQDTLLSIIAGVLLAMWLVALMSGDGSKGILDLF